jgi:hypothetical protein
MRDNHDSSLEIIDNSDCIKLNEIYPFKEYSRDFSI